MSNSKVKDDSTDRLAELEEANRKLEEELFALKLYALKKGDIRFKVFDEVKADLIDIYSTLDKYTHKKTNDIELIATLNDFVVKFAETLGIEPIGRIGDPVKFSSKLHRSGGDNLPEGTPAVIIKPGLRLKNSEALIAPLVAKQ